MGRLEPWTWTIALCLAPEPECRGERSKGCKKGQEPAEQARKSIRGAKNTEKEP